MWTSGSAPALSSQGSGSAGSRGSIAGLGATQGWTRTPAPGRLTCCKNEEKSMTRPCHRPQPAGTRWSRSPWLPGHAGQGRCPRAAAAHGPGGGDRRQRSPRRWLLSQQSSSSKSSLIRAGTWCFRHRVPLRQELGALLLTKAPAGSAPAWRDLRSACCRGCPGLWHSPRLLPDQKGESKREN